MDGFQSKAMISRRERRIRAASERGRRPSRNNGPFSRKRAVVATVVIVAFVRSIAMQMKVRDRTASREEGNGKRAEGGAVADRLRDFAKPIATKRDDGTQPASSPMVGTTEATDEGSIAVETRNDQTADFLLPRVLVLVFPQFHREPLNDRFWGEGFTDWDNLRKAPMANRNGDRIPRPTELGYYDLTQTEPRKKQGELAKEYGIDGFVYHHYWFYDDEHPGPNLHVPLVNMLKDGHPDVPFALHWCAVKWMTTWSGEVSPTFKFKEPGVLQKQYFPTDMADPKIEEHYRWLRQFFKHPNYIKVDGNKPVFMLYQKKPGAMVVLKRLRQLAIEDGFGGLMLTVGLTKPHEHLMTIQDEGLLRKVKMEEDRVMSFNLYDKVVSYPNPSDWAANRTLEIPGWCRGRLHSSKRLKDIVGIISSFDNTPRRNLEEANLFATGNRSEVVVERFRKSLHAALYYESCCCEVDVGGPRRKGEDDRFVLINAMNEWAEGMALEPSDVYGRTFLEAIRDTKRQLSRNQCSLG